MSTQKTNALEQKLQQEEKKAREYGFKTDEIKVLVDKLKIFLLENLQGKYEYSYHECGEMDNFDVTIEKNDEKLVIAVDYVITNTIDGGDFTGNFNLNLHNFITRTMFSSYACPHCQLNNCNPGNDLDNYFDTFNDLDNYFDTFLKDLVDSFGVPDILSETKCSSFHYPI